MAAAAMNAVRAAAMNIGAKYSLLRHRVLSWQRSVRTGADLQPFRRPPIWYHKLTRFALLAGASSATFLTVYYTNHRETVPFTNRTRFVLIPPSLERWLANRRFETRKYYLDILPPTHPDCVRVKLISDKIIHAAMNHHHNIPTTPIPAFDWEVVVVGDEKPICCCYSGGKIVISIGAIRYWGTDIVLAEAMGHEVGHAIARHIPETTTKMYGFKLMYIILLRRLMCLPFLVEKLSKPFLGGQQLSKVLFELPLSRRLENEADYIGLMLLASAGYYPGDVPDRREKESQIDWTDGYDIHLSTHPSFKERSRLASQAMDAALAIYWKVISTSCNDDA